MQLDLWQQNVSASTARPTRCSKARAGRGDLRVASSLAEAHAEAQRLAEQAYTPGTKKAYQANWNAFADWCAAHDLVSLPATVDTLCDYLAQLKLAGHRYSTIQAKKTAIGLAHAHAGLGRPDLDVRVRTLELSIAKAIDTDGQRSNQALLRA